MGKTMKFAIILSGCGVYDGTEIREAVLTLLAIEQNGASYEMFAPDVDQLHTINHLTGEEMKEKRNVLIEAARIARGKIKSLKEFNVNDFDALILPGGFGGAKNLSDYAVSGIDMKVNGDVERAVKEIHKAKKPLGSLCITPVVVARIIKNIEVTIGHNDPSIKDIEEFGATHIPTKSGEIYIDKKNKLVTAPCYMLDAKVMDIAKETDLVVRAMMEMV